MSFEIGCDWIEAPDPSLHRAAAMAAWIPRIFAPRLSVF